MNDDTESDQIRDEKKSKTVTRQLKTPRTKVYGEKFRLCRGCRAPMTCDEAGECPMEEPLSRLEEAWKPRL